MVVLERDCIWHFNIKKIEPSHLECDYIYFYVDNSNNIKIHRGTPMEIF